MPIAIKNKPPGALLDAALRRAGFKRGETLEFKVPKKMVTIIPRQTADDSAPPERRAIDKMIAASDKDYKEGRTYGPFTTAEEMAVSIEGNIKKLRAAKRKTKSVR